MERDSTGAAQPTVAGPRLTPEMFDEEFSRVAESPWLRQVFSEDLPAEVDPYSFITLDGLETLITELRLAPGCTLVDLACGRGGPGLFLAKESGARLVGVDFSRVGVEHARRRAEEFAPSVEARYVIADATDTSLQSGEADALVCIDAIQLMPHPAAVAVEVARLLAVGGRAGFTTWERDGRLPDLGKILESASLAVQLIQQRDDWRERERAIFERARRDAKTSDDPGCASLAEEAEHVLAEIETSRRVLVIAERTAV